MRNIGLDRLLRRVGHLAAAGNPADLVAAWVTPILRHRCNWKRASMAAALGYHASDADRGPRLCFQVQKDSYNTQKLIGVLEQLAGFYAGQQVVLVWDGWGRTGATTCAPGWRPSGTGCRWSGCRPLRPS
jgi:hypothetical protein